MSTEADICRKYVIPRLRAAGWGDEPHSIGEQQTFTDGQIVVIGGRPRRRAQKRADYVLRYRRDFPIAVVEAKPDYKLPGDGLQQAKEYARILGLKFAYATNGSGIAEFDYTTGMARRSSRCRMCRKFLQSQNWALCPKSFVISWRRE